MPPVNRNLVQRIRQALYSLKRDYGAEITVYKLVSSETEVTTGARQIVTESYRVKRAIVMPVKITRDQKQSISLISSNKEFVEGGTYDVGTRDFIIDRRDISLPELSADDWIIYNRKKYQIRSVENFEVDAGWIITARELIGEVPNNPVYAQADDSLAFADVSDINPNAIYIESVSDAMSLSDDVVSILAHLVAVADVLAFTDATSGSLIHSEAISDSLGLSESFTASSANNEIISNTLTLNESTSTRFNRAASVSHTLALSDAATGVLSVLPLDQVYIANFFNNEVWRVPLDGGVGQQVLGSVSTTGDGPYYLHYQPDPAGDSLYYSFLGNNKGFGKISSLGVNTLLFGDTEGSGLGLDIDPVNGHVYIGVQGGDNSIHRFNLDGTNKQVIVPTSAGVTRVYGLRLDLLNGHIYFCDRFNKRIARCTLSGSSITTIATTSGEPWGLFFDYVNQWLYWTEIETGGHRIVRSDLDGGNQVVILSGLNQPLGIAIHYQSRKLYFCDSLPAGGKALKRCNLDGSSVETLYNVVGGGSNADPHGLVIPLSSNVAGNRLAFVSSASATVTPGPKLVSDQLVLTSSASARVGDPKLYYGTFGTPSIRRTAIDGTSPATINASLPSGVRRLDLLTNGDIIWCGNNGLIYKLTQAGVNTTLHTPTGGVATRGLRVDNTNGFIYYCAAASDSVIRRITTAGASQTAIAGPPSLNDPYDLDLDLTNGFIYFVERAGKKIRRCTLAGASVTDLVTGRTGEPYCIALDVPNNKIYWGEIGTVGQKKIFSSTLAGASVTTVVDLGTSEPLDISINVDKLFFSDSDNKRIRRCDLDGSNIVNIVTGITGSQEPFALAVV